MWFRFLMWFRHRRGVWMWVAYDILDTTVGSIWRKSGRTWVLADLARLESVYP